MPRRAAFDVEGPVQAELFVVWLDGDHLELTGPSGPAPWILELGDTDHPVEARQGQRDPELRRRDRRRPGDAA